MSSRNQKLEQQVKIMFYSVLFFSGGLFLSIVFLARGERKFLPRDFPRQKIEKKRTKKSNVSTRKRTFGRDG